ncbi:hypothetical protein ILYODFUR_039069 [Ilyodon furcidens]|uniref:Uncharacterized protein n=1 Tax=Ilyodon furcidens TaxID=33524 RepID=A0ABV0V2M0_9TELE
MCSKSTLQSVESVYEMLQNPNIATDLQVHFQHMEDNSKVIVQLLNTFQSRHLATTKTFDYLEDVQMNFAANKKLQHEARAMYFKGVDEIKKRNTCQMGILHLPHV